MPGGRHEADGSSEDCFEDFELFLVPGGVDEEGLARQHGVVAEWMSLSPTVVDNCNIIEDAANRKDKLVAH